ncbi:hypothetical protein BGZ79_007599 [Entomortierella chlamydospora]|nr:hypothetical protein BGZ79_007599 [Entomortierella chlamydospora]
MPAILYGKPKVNIQFMFAASTCHVFDYKTYKQGKIFERYPYNTKLIPFQPNVDTVTIGSIYGGSSMTVYGRALVPIVIKNRLFQVDVYLVDLHPAIQCILSMGFLTQYRIDLDFSTTNRLDGVIFRD